MKFSIVVFPGSNCDQDCAYVVRELLRCEAEYVWHVDRDLKGADAVIIPGGFAYGDYLRAGALARFSPVMESVADFARSGGPVLGICNGFQVLLEAGLLPGAMRVNRGLRYVCRDVFMRVENSDTPFTRLFDRGSVVKMPIGHMEGNYTAPAAVLDALEANGRVVFRYSDERGAISEAANPNGADRGIAGICNEAGNVVGLMPHPDRCAEGLLGNDAGIQMFRSAVESLAVRGSR
jgi:phosphoribosylformylglycinamidine synthase subunit PurQ / glutaminase